MQPTFIPWIGYFAMIERVERFVFLDSVQFAKRSWQQRNQIKGASGVNWITVPVITKGLKDQLIKDVKINEFSKFLNKFKNTLKTYYGKTKYFKDFNDLINSNVEKSNGSLSEMNINIIVAVSKILGIKTEFSKSSDLNLNGNKAELLANICQYYKAKNYISALGSKGYISESNAFEKRDIEVFYHEYNHPEYLQIFGDFVPFMSILDLLFNEGENSYTIIKKGYS